MNGNYITADNWLYNVDVNTIGTLGLGIGSDLWWNTSTSFINPLTNSFSFQISTGPVTNWMDWIGTLKTFTPSLIIGVS